MKKNVWIAFASTDRVRVDQHFGAAAAFAIYEVRADGARLVEIAEFLDAGQDGFDAKLPGKIATLSGCAAVYCLAAGASAVRQLLAAGIQPIRVAEGSPIESLLGDIRHEIAAGPGGWLAKAIRAGESRDGGRFDAMEAEGWQE